MPKKTQKVKASSPQARSSPVKKRARRGSVVAITGSGGFLGRNLVAVFEEDCTISKIVVLDLCNASTAGPKTVFYHVDLTLTGVESRISEILNAEQVESFVHLAFCAGPTQAVAWAHELESVGTMHVLSACRQFAVSKFITCTSTLAYGALPDNPNHLKEDRKLRGLRGAPFVAEKLDVERQLRRFQREQPNTVVTVLRMAPVLGPSVDNFVARWLTRSLVPTVLGHDPLVQFLHEVDAVAALRLALDNESSAVLNIVGRGVLPVSTVARLAGRVPVPIPFSLLRGLTSLLWVAQLNEAPAEFVYLLRYLCVADGELAARRLGFHPAYSTADAVLDFESAQRMREARVLASAQ